MVTSNKINCILRNKTSRNEAGSIALNGLTDNDAAEALRFHKSLPIYHPTELVELSGLSKQLNVKGIYVKDESSRFGLNAFKGLGGTYAMFRVLCEKLGINYTEADYNTFQKDEIKKQVTDITFITATDGNHGKGVSWAGRLFGCKAFVFMPAGSSEERAKAIREAGPAVVEITKLNYDETVFAAKQMAEEKGWTLIQDTAWDGYEQVPLWIIQGYLTMAWEAIHELEAKKIFPTHVFLQAGVGAMAGGICGFMVNHYGYNCPNICLVEPETAACIYLSVSCGDGEIHSVTGNPVTIMAGLNCGTPCKITWPVLRDYVSAYFSIPDCMAAEGMRVYAKPLNGDKPIISGESGAATMGAMLGLLRGEDMASEREKLGISKDSVILLINTEGDTDPDCYKSIINGIAYSE